MLLERGGWNIGGSLMKNRGLSLEEQRGLSEARRTSDEREMA